jgi:hypothetical protein
LTQSEIGYEIPLSAEGRGAGNARNQWANEGIMASSERTEATSASPATTATPATATPAPAGSGADQGGGLSGAEAATPAVIDALRCDLLMNARYHSSREAYLDTLHRVLMFLIIVLGAAAVTDLIGPAPWAHIAKGAAAAFAVVFAAIDLTADLSNRARQHALMKRRYFELLADLIANKKPLDVESLMHRFSADEEPVFNALLATCWNAAQEMVYGDHADAYDIPWWHKPLKNLVRFGRKYDVIKGSRPTPVLA